MARSVELVVEGAFDAATIAAGFDDIGDASQRMADDVDRATRSAEDSVDRMGSVSDAADNMGSSASQAAGGLGDLGGALSAVPGPLGAVGAGMETVAPLVMGVTGATDLLNLAMNSNVVTSVRQKAATAASTAATLAASAASKVAAAGQWALNAALSANPVGIVVVAVAALVAGLVLAYNKSETFRNIVNTAMGAARTAVGWVVDKVSDVADKVENVTDKVPSIGTVFDNVKSTASNAIGIILTPLNTFLGVVKDIVDWVGKIKFPDPPDWLDKLPFGRFGDGGSGTGGFSASVRGDDLPFGNTVVNIYPRTISVADLLRALRREGIELGDLV